MIPFHMLGMVSC